MTFNSEKIIITRGLSFMGSNPAIRLLQEGAHVTVTDSLLSEYGVNLYNIKPIRDRMRGCQNLPDIEHIYNNLRHPELNGRQVETICNAFRQWRAEQ
jgi:hypothetical protein